MADEESKPTEETPQEIAKPKGKHLWKKGECPNPLGRPVGTKSISSKIMSKLTQLWLRADAPDEWFANGLEFLQTKAPRVPGTQNNPKLFISELIMARMAYCLAMNIPYKNTALLKELFDRSEGKIPLRIVHKPGDDGAEEDLTQLSYDEVKAYFDNVDQRTRLAAQQLSQEVPAPQLTEGAAEEKDAGNSEDIEANTD